MRRRRNTLRNTLSCVLATLVVVVCLGVWNAAAREPAPALIERFDSLLLTTMKQGDALDFDQRYHRIAQRIDTDFDIAQIAHRRLGGQWAQMSAQARHAYVARLRHTLIARYAHDYDHYAGQHFMISGLRTLAGDTREVEAALVEPDGRRRVTHYILASDHGRWRVVGLSQPSGYAQAAITNEDTPQALFGWLGRPGTPATHKSPPV
ncbi:ABC transporter substrate-binding protein [Salinisphaera sp. S4-8]|uniref:ABC transporter substrate-binding protein n=1 Tax=Salinisphaera sp. S4-8 TaxID=633357 RepID=UPI00334066D4